jgi:hypothetical protein
MAIASCLVDTNILLRMTRRSDPQHKVVDTALALLAGQEQQSKRKSPPLQNPRGSAADGLLLGSAIIK